MIGRTLSQFRILTRIGEGGMGVVYRAEDEKLRRPVALKVLPPELVADPDRRLRFLREARAAAAVNHPNIAAIYEIDEADGIVFIAMELVEGRTLRELSGGRPLPIKDSVRVACGIAEGLARAHQARVIHRDLKPDNVMVGADLHVKILDFGLAKLLEEAKGPAATAPASGNLSRLETISEELTREGRIFGTASYMSPEQARGQPLDPRSDLFSFGATLYETVTGRTPFQGKTATDILSAIVRDQPPPPSRLNAAVPAELDRILGKCLEKDPDERYQHTDDLVVDLRKLRRTTDSGLQVVQGPGAQEAVAHRWLGRALTRPAVRAAGVAGLVILTGLVAAGLVSHWLFKGDGEQLPALREQQLTANPLEQPVLDAAISPDGKYLAYADPEGLKLRVIDTGDIHSIPIPSVAIGLGGELSWYPDNARLLVTAGSRGPGARRAQNSLWLVSVFGRAPRKLRDDVWSPAVSPDGSRIAFLDATRKPPREIWLMGPDGEEPRRIATAEEGSQLWWVGWSPDGNRLIYGRSQQKDEIFGAFLETRSRDGADPSVLVSGDRLAQDYHGVLHAAWLPDQRVVYSLSEPWPDVFDSDLWEIGTDPRTGRPLGEPKRLTRWPGTSARLLRSSADGKRLSFLRVRPRPDVYVGELEAASKQLRSLERLTWDERLDWPSAWTPDSQYVLFTSNRRGNMDIYRQRIGTREAEAIVSTPADELDPVPAPGGSFILYWHQASAPGGDGDGGVRKIMRVPAGGGPSEPVLEAVDEDNFDCASLPGGRCVVSRQTGNLLLFFELDPLRGIGKELARVETDPSTYNGWDLSPDGSRVAVVNWKYYVRVVSLADGSTRDIPTGEWDARDGVAWAADGRGFFSYGGSPDSEGMIALFFVDLEGRARAVRSEANAWNVAPVPSPDGRHLAFQAFRFESNAWMVERF